MEFRPRRKPSLQEENQKRRKKEEKIFAIGEKILCFEPDEKLEKVLYDAKVRDIFEAKDKRGRKSFEYLVHFQGWSTNWDRKVSEDFLLKDTTENRKLQRDLAEKSQLQLGAYLYRRERKKRRRLSEKNKLLNINSSQRVDGQIDNENEYYSSSATESHDDDRVFLHMGDVLKAHLEYDHRLITIDHVSAKLPSSLPAVVILENFVKNYALKVFTGPQPQPKPRRRLSIVTGKEQKKIDYGSLANSVDMCKEVADGLRIYFNFILKDFLLYPEEKESFDKITSDEEMMNLKFKLNDNPTIEKFICKPDIKKVSNVASLDPVETPAMPPRLRSHSSKTEDEEKPENLSSMASTSSGEFSSAPLDAQRKGFFSKSWHPLSSGINPVARRIIEETFKWHMIPLNASPEPSMIFGAYHLTRLIVKLPEFLSATPMNEEKLTILLKFLDEFLEFLEENPEIYGPQNYNLRMSSTNEDKV